MINWIKGLFGFNTTTEAEKQIIEDTYKVEPKVINIVNIAAPKLVKTIKAGTAKAPKAPKAPKATVEKAEKVVAPKAAKAVNTTKPKKAKTPEVKLAESIGIAPKVSKAWYNNGTEQKLLPESEVPKGWNKGKLPKAVK